MLSSYDNYFVVKIAGKSVVDGEPGKPVPPGAKYE